MTAQKNKIQESDWIYILGVRLYSFEDKIDGSLLMDKIFGEEKVKIKDDS
jgi:hypothetical protein